MLVSEQLYSIWYISVVYQHGSTYGACYTVSTQSTSSERVLTLFRVREYVLVFAITVR
jgi:hypothetical protein